MKFVLLELIKCRAPGCQRDYESKAGVNTVALHPNQGELISGDQDGIIHVWDLTANCCVKTMVCDHSSFFKSMIVMRLPKSPHPSVPIRSITTASDGTIAVAATNDGLCYVWPLTEPNFHMGEKRTGMVAEGSSRIPLVEPFTLGFQAHDAIVLKCLLSPDAR